MDAPSPSARSLRPTYSVLLVPAHIAALRFLLLPAPMAHAPFMPHALGIHN